MSTVDIQKREDIKLLLALCDSKFLTQSQIHQWFYAGQRQKVTTRQRLIKLCSAKILKDRQIPMQGTLEDRKVYFLGPQAAFAIDQKCRELLGQDPPYSFQEIEASRRRANRANSPDRIVHEVYISQLRMCLDLSHCKTELWRPESYFRKYPLGVKGKRNLIPDALLGLRLPDGRKRAFFVEVDAYSKGAKEVLDKAERYAKYWESGAFKQKWKAPLGLGGDKPGFIMLNIIPANRQISTWINYMSKFSYPRLSFLFYCSKQNLIKPETIEKPIWQNAKGQSVSIAEPLQGRRVGSTIVKVQPKEKPRSIY